MAERQVDDVDAERALFGVANSIALMTSLVYAVAVRVEHFQDDELDARRDAPILAVRSAAAAANQAGDVRAVAVVVLCGAGRAGEVSKGADPAGECRLRPARARVDDRHANAAPVHRP